MRFFDRESEYAHDLEFRSGDITHYTRDRSHGLPVRPVRDPGPEYVGAAFADLPRLDTRDAITAVLGETLELTYSSSAFGEDYSGKTVSVTVNGDALPVTGSESYNFKWTPTEVGTYELAHTPGDFAVTVYVLETALRDLMDRFAPYAEIGYEEGDPGVLTIKLTDDVDSALIDCAFAKRAVRDNEGYWILADPVDPKKVARDPYERLEDALVPLPEYYGPFTPGVPVAFTDKDLIGCVASGLNFGLKFDKKTGSFSGVPTKAGVYKVKFTKSVKDEATKRTVAHVATTTFLVASLGFTVDENGLVTGVEEPSSL